MTKRCLAGEGSDLLSDVVDETLREVFREEGTNIIYGYMKNEYHLKLEEVAAKPEVFSVGLETLLGSGGPVIEKIILTRLYSKLKLEFKEKKAHGFSDYVRELEKLRLSEDEVTCVDAGKRKTLKAKTAIP